MSSRYCYFSPCTSLPIAAIHLPWLHPGARFQQTPLQICCTRTQGSWIRYVDGSRTLLIQAPEHSMFRKWGHLGASCLENPRDGGAWWAAIYGVAQSWTRLKRLSSSSSSRSLLIHVYPTSPWIMAAPWLCRKFIFSASVSLLGEQESYKLWPNWGVRGKPHH